MTPKEHAIQLLAQGIPTSQVAAAVGVSDSYISQLKSDEEVQRQIAERQAAHSIADSAFDETLERAESLALEKIEKNLPFANMGQALAAFRVLNSARRRKDEVLQRDTAVSVTVNLTLPASSLPRYTTNQANEIIEVEGKTMLSASAKTLDQILAARAGETQAALPQVTATEKAAAILSSLAPLPRKAPVRSPLPINADCL
jgi:transcriptional regulator with XRE-family HTH domain